MLTERKVKAQLTTRRSERGAALPTALIVLALITVISASVLAIVSSEASVAGGDLHRTQTFYAAQAGLERMTNRFNGLFTLTTSPTQTDLNTAANDPLTELTSRGFAFPSPEIIPDGTSRQTQIPDGPFVGLNAIVQPYRMTMTATMTQTGAEVQLQRWMNNYQIPLFQFGIFSDDDIELHPGPPFFFNGRVHANGNLYVNGDTKFLNRVTVANEIVTSVLRNGIARTPDVKVQVGASTVPLTLGSVNNGPNLPVGQQYLGRGNFPGHPGGTINAPWDTASIAAPNGTANRFGGQVLSRTTGARPLLLPLQLGGSSTRELIKRRASGDTTIMTESRFHDKAHIRILIDDEGATSTSDSSSIMAYQANGTGAGAGELLSTWTPDVRGDVNGTNGNALARLNDNGTFASSDIGNTNRMLQRTRSTSTEPARTVRRVNSQAICVNGSAHADCNDSTRQGVRIPGGSGIQGRILIEVLQPDGTVIDVTQAVLSLGVTVGEPNAVVHLQRPMWAAFMQGSRDRNAASSRDTNLSRLISLSRTLADGEINSSITLGTSYISVNDSSLDDEGFSASPIRQATATGINEIVPINVYNPREGAIHNTLLVNQVYERGITSVVEINMRNLTRWLTGVYDTALLNGTNAVSTNVGSLGNGYIVYVSDRRGDLARTTGAVTATNGIVDNEDIYGNNGQGNGTHNAPCSSTTDQNGCERGEDANGDGFLSRDIAELPFPVVNEALFPSTNRATRAQSVSRWWNPNVFHRAVRVFDGADLHLDGPVSDLTETRGVTITTENMVYIWGSYNTTGITGQPAGGSTLNTGGYAGDQVPAAIIADAFTPLSRNWFDASSALAPEGSSAPSGFNTLRNADTGSPAIGDETAVRCGIIAGNNLGALAGDPSAGNSAGNDERRMNGGIHNYPRFLETWGGRRWSYVGSLVPLYRSTQALGPYNSVGQIYSPPTRNWAFDTTFTDPAKLPPGTPMFQYIEPTAFRQIL